MPFTYLGTFAVQICTIWMFNINSILLCTLIRVGYQMKYNIMHSRIYDLILTIQISECMKLQLRFSQFKIKGKPVSSISYLSSTPPQKIHRNCPQRRIAHFQVDVDEFQRQTSIQLMKFRGGPSLFDEFQRRTPFWGAVC